MPACLARRVFTRMLHTIPLTVVESRKEVDDIKELLNICKEYHIGLRCELKRKVSGRAQAGRKAAMGKGSTCADSSAGASCCLRGHKSSRQGRLSRPPPPLSHQQLLEGLLGHGWGVMWTGATF